MVEIPIRFMNVSLTMVLTLIFIEPSVLLAHTKLHKIS